MIKDPLNTQETPYDILDMDLNTPMSGIHQALIEFMKKNKVVSKISMAQEAVRKLKNIQERITFDLTYYTLEVIEDSSFGSLCDIHGIVSKQICVPVITSPDYISDVLADNEPYTLPELAAQTIRIDNFGSYPVENEQEFFMPFERSEYHPTN